jgi:ribonuclease inhibitor
MPAFANTSTLAAIMKPCKQYDIFELTKDINPVVKKGMIGVILEVWNSNNFEVEFVKNDGSNYVYEGFGTFTVDSSFFEDMNIIDLKLISSIDELHKKFKIKLNFPDFYGMNWDAFWDAITGLVEMPAILRLIGWSEFTSKFPSDSRILRELIQDFNDHFHQHKVIVTDQ